MIPPMAPRPAAAVGRGPKLVLSLVVVLWAAGFWVAALAPVPVGAGAVPEPVREAVVLAAEAVAQATSVGRPFTPTASQICCGGG